MGWFPLFFTSLAAYVCCGAKDASCDFARADGRDLTQRTFDTKFLDRKPVVLTHLMDDWPAYLEERWSESEFLERYSRGKFAVHSWEVSDHDNRVEEFQDGTLLEEHLNSGSATSWFISPSHQMVADIRARKDWNYPALLRYVSKSGPYISIGRRSQGSRLRSADTMWFAQVRGRTRWFVLPDDAAGFSREADKTNAPRYAASPSSSRLNWPCGPVPKRKDGRTCILEPGELIVLPKGYYHETCSLDHFNIGVAYIGRHSAFNENEFRIAEGHLIELKDSATCGEKSADLHWAALHGHVELVDFMVQRVDDVDIERNVHGMKTATPLDLAAKAGHLSIVNSLIKAGASTGAPLELSFTRSAMLWAVQGCHCSVIERLLDWEYNEGAEDAWSWRSSYARKKEGETMMADALRRFVDAGHVGCTRLFLNAFPWLPSSDELMRLALRAGHVRVTRFLLDEGVEVPPYQELGKLTRHNIRLLHFLALRGVNGTIDLFRTALLVPKKLNESGVVEFYSNSTIRWASIVQATFTNRHNAVVYAIWEKDDGFEVNLGSLKAGGKLTVDTKAGDSWAFRTAPSLSGHLVASFEIAAGADVQSFDVRPP